MMRCEQALTFVERLVDGECTESEAARARDHMQSCSRCRDHFQFADLLHAAARTPLPEPPPAYWDLFPRKVMTRIRTPSVSRLQWSRWLAWRPLAAAGAGLALALGVGSSFWISTVQREAPLKLESRAATLVEDSGLERTITGERPAGETETGPAMAPASPNVARLTPPESEPRRSPDAAGSTSLARGRDRSSDVPEEDPLKSLGRQQVEPGAVRVAEPSPSAGFTEAAGGGDPVAAPRSPYRETRGGATPTVGTARQSVRPGSLEEECKALRAFLGRSNDQVERVSLLRRLAACSIRLYNAQKGDVELVQAIEDAQTYLNHPGVTDDEQEAEKMREELLRLRELRSK